MLFWKLLPTNLTINEKNLDNGSKTTQLDTLISRFNKYFKEIGGNIEPFKKLKEHKDLLLNPLSHDNTESPIYKRELDNIIEILEKLNQLKVHTIGMDDDANQHIFELHETDLTGNNWVIEFTLKEIWRGIKDLDGSWHLLNPNCHFLTKQNITQNTAKVELGTTVKLRQGYGNIRYNLGIKTKENCNVNDNEKDLKEIVYKDGQKLIDKLNK